MSRDDRRSGKGLRHFSARCFTNDHHAGPCGSTYFNATSVGEGMTGTWHSSWNNNVRNNLVNIATTTGLHALDALLDSLVVEGFPPSTSMFQSSPVFVA